VFEKSIPVIDPALPVRKNPQKSGLVLLLGRVGILLEHFYFKDRRKGKGKE
jgi:hypothetical protein